MPELPEVEVVRRGLAELIIGKKVKAVTHNWPKSFPNAKEDVSQFLIGSRITFVSRRAKIIIINLSSEYSLLVHLKMTGQLVFRGKKSFGAGHPSKSLVGELPDKSTRVQILFSGGSHLFFNDQRKFGWMRLLPTAHLTEIDYFKDFGPEPLETTFTEDLFVSRLQRRLNSNIKAVLLDQSVIAGVGNIYADESLWGAKIHPAELVRNINEIRLKELHKELLYVLRLSIDKGGSSDKNYVSAKGKKGSYTSFARVFRREKQQCPRCATIIEKTKVAGRGTHFCPTCQPKP